MDSWEMFAFYTLDECVSAKRGPEESGNVSTCHTANAHIPTIVIRDEQTFDSWWFIWTNDQSSVSSSNDQPMLINQRWPLN